MVKQYAILRVAGFLCALFSVMGYAENAALPNEQSSLTLYVENDLLSRTDKYYTSGVQLTYLTKDLEAMKLPPWLQEVGGLIPMFRHEGYTNNIGLSVGQQIFTPENTQATSLIRNDRPYAGWLFGGLSLHHKNTVNLHVLELRAGIVGPDAMGEAAQNGVHELRNLATAKGWKNQLHNEPGAVLTYEYRRRADATLPHSLFGADIIPAVRVSGGNVLTEGAVGINLRAGFNLPRDFHGNRMRTTGFAMSPEDGYERLRSPWSAYVFGGAESRYVAHNIFLDGNTWRTSHSVKREPFVGEVQGGFGLMYKRVRLTFTHVIRTREFQGQRGDHHSFGAVSLGFWF